MKLLVTILVEIVGRFFVVVEIVGNYFVVDVVNIVGNIVGNYCC